MEAKLKAVELVDNYVMLVGSDWNDLAKAKKCAIISVDECMLACSAVGVIIDKRLNDKTFSKSIIEDSAFLFWQQVKEEIEKL